MSEEEAEYIFSGINEPTYKELQQENKQLKETIYKVTELIKNGIDFKSLYFIRGKDEDIWKIILADSIKEELLKILGDKE